jgi:acetate---CoA ligase (ADP-forming)
LTANPIVSYEEDMSKSRIFAELDRIFHPRSVALIGASGKKGKIGRLFVDGFLEMGFRTLYPVNPRETEILGVRTFPAITDIPGPVDLAIIITPTDSVLRAVTQCALKGVKAVVITTAGFAEAGGNGKEVEQEMVRIARERDVRIIGPNCIGIYCPSSKLPFLLGAGKESGSVGLVSQSGFFADFLALTATANGIHFSKGVSCGNEADLSATDFLEYLGADPATEMIVAYLEGIKDGRRFYSVSKEISRRKPVILWKGGVTEAGARAAVSHTGAMAGSRLVWEGALRQAGIISVKSFEEALDCLYGFYFQPLPRGPRVAIISGPGGTAVGTADTCHDLGLEVPRFSAHTLEKLREAIPVVGGSAHNPVDLSLAALVTPGLYKEAIRIASEDENIDMLLVISIVGGERLRDIIVEAMEGIRTKKPVVVTVMARDTRSAGQDFPLLLGSSISVYPDAARATRVLARLWDYSRFRLSRSTGKAESGKENQAIRRGKTDAIRAALTEGRRFLSEHESKEILRAYGIPVTREKEVKSERQFREALGEIGFPLVIKACGPSLNHKTEHGLVHVDVRNRREAMAAFKKMNSASKDEGLSMLVQEMVRGSRELVVGLTRDKQFGPCVMFGLGGIYTEVLGDVLFRVAPIDRSEAFEMMNAMKSRGILESFRGMPAADLDQLADILIAVGNMGIEQPHIREIDINPVILSESKPIAVDALIGLGP